MTPHEEDVSRRRAMPPGSALVALSLLWTLGTGVVLAVKSVRPDVAMNWLPWERVQPAHTLGVMALLCAGVGALLELVLEGAGARLRSVRRFLIGALGGFFVIGAGAIATGRSSGLEYTTWPLALTVVPAAFMAVAACSVWVELDHLCERSPEGAWVLLMGVVLAALGMVDRMAGARVLEPTRALMIEWHTLDTLFAGLNTSLYGLGILLASRPGAGKGLRPRPLYALAVIALLSTFGHHHYASAQPDLLKWTAFGASMLGMVSFVRHMAMSRRGAVADRDDPSRLLRLAGVWTAFAVGSGVLMAVPQLNSLVHGTHAIVAHSMGSVIGVNVFLILAGLLSCLPEKGRTPATAVASIALLLIVIDLLAAGVLRGVLRLEGARPIHLRAVRGVLTPLPVIGLALAGSLGLLALRVLGGLRPRVHAGEPASRRHGFGGHRRAVRRGATRHDGVGGAAG